MRSKRARCNQRTRSLRASSIGGWLVALVVAGASPAAALAQEFCGSLENAFGPYDYLDPRNHTPARLGIVEGAHFTPDVEQLVRGASSVDPLDDLDYTLRAFPNHHRALYAISRYFLAKATTMRGRYSIECWFERAARFRPDDGVVPAIYGVYLAKKGDRTGALEQYNKSLELMPDFAEAHYNLALLYIDMKNYTLANEHAVIAYGLGYPLPGLRRRLQELGAWNPAAGQKPAAGQNPVAGQKPAAQ